MVANRVWLDVVDKTVVVRKQFNSPTIGAAGQTVSPTARFRSEVYWLRRTEGLPTVNLVETDHSTLTLTTRFAASRTLAHPGWSQQQVAIGLILACEALHLLHREGAAHGAIHPEHVLAKGRQVWLCGAAPTGASPAADALSFTAMAQDLADLQSTAVSESPGRGRRLRPLLYKRKRQSNLEAAVAVMNHDFRHRLPNPKLLAKLLRC